MEQWASEHKVLLKLRNKDRDLEKWYDLVEKLMHFIINSKEKGVLTG